MDNSFTVKHPKFKRLYALTLAALAWISIGLQFYITDLSTVNFFSYFTTLCNLLIAVCLTCSILLPQTQIGRFFDNISAHSAIAVYIFIVSLVYNLVLRGIWVLNGLGWVLDNMVHVVIPVLYLLYWFLFRPQGRLKWRDGFYWAIFPTLYLAYSLVRGSMIQWYPYPFLNAAKFGYEKVLVNISLIMAVFLAVGLILILITRATQGKSAR